METVTFAWTALKVALGLGFVIFIHELGHFLLAKWNGVKVEKFSVGFGPTLVSFRRGVGLRIGTGSRPPGPADPPSYGETEYILAALPLGGYVKMLGESTEDHNPQDVEKSTDPRAFHNKPVGGRMAIITAGVIMNLILGFVCFSFVHTQPGIDFQPKLAGVLPGSPAALAGLKAGDEIVAVDGERNVSLNQIVAKIKLSGAGQKIDFRVKRAGSEGEKAITIEPKPDVGSPMPAIGIYYPALGLDLARDVPFSSLPGQTGDSVAQFGGFEGGDTVVGVGAVGKPITPVADHNEFVRQLDSLRREPVVVAVERGESKADGSKASPGRRVEVVVPPHPFVDFGFRLAAGPVAAVEPDSPAGRAGFRKGDEIVTLEGEAEFDPMTLPDYIRDHAGSPVWFMVKRSNGSKAAESLKLTATPDSSPPWTQLSAQVSRIDPLDLPGLGMAIWVEPKIVAIQPDSPAARSGLKVGDVIRSAVITPAKADKAAGKPLTFKSADNSLAWPAAFAFIQDNQAKSIQLRVNDSEELIELKPEIVPGRYHPLRGLNFVPATRVVPPAPFAAALRLGAAETWENVTGIYKIFRSLAQRRVGGDAFGGMIPIAQVAYNSASAGFTPFVQFLGILSINLAVLNFLPIPPLDGGQFLFLAAEKVRGKPLPDAYLAAGTIAGIAFVLILIVVINVKDVVQLVTG